MSKGYSEPAMTDKTARDMLVFHGLDPSRASDLVGLTYTQAAVVIGKWLRDVQNNR